MTRRISLIGALVGAGLVLAPTAAGKGQLAGQDFWNYDRNGQQVANSSPGLAGSDLVALYGGETTIRVAPVGSPDAFDRAVAARQRHQAAMLDARERSLTERSAVQSPRGAIDLRERAFGAKLEARLGAGTSPDVVQRAMDARTRTLLEPVRDDRFRLDPTSNPGPVSVTSGREIEWPQIGIGFGIGLLLAAGLYLAMRFTRIRPLAH